MKANKLFAVDIGVECVLVEENRASSVMGHREPTSENARVDILRCFLQSDDVPPACDLLFEGIFISASGTSIPVVDTQTLLHSREKSVVAFFEHRPCVVLR